MGPRVYVGRLSYDCRERDLEKFFKGFGKVREVLLKNGFGFVEFDDYRDADDAVYELNGKEFLGGRVVVEHAKGPNRGRSDTRGGGGRGRGAWLDKYGPPTRTDYRVVVENLSSGVSWQDLKDFMRKAGEVTYADAHKRRNEGVVEFSSRSDMKAAVERLNGTELNGRKLKIYEERPSGRRSSKRSRSRSRSRSSKRSRSRSRSKSRSRSRSKSRSPLASRRSRSRSRSRTPKKFRQNDSKSKSKSRSKSMEKNRSKSRSLSRSKSP